MSCPVAKIAKFEGFWHFLHHKQPQTHYIVFHMAKNTLNMLFLLCWWDPVKDFTEQSHFLHPAAIHIVCVRINFKHLEQWQGPLIAIFILNVVKQDESEV